MMQILYRILYSPFINLIARNLNKGLHKVIPTIFKLPPSGIIRLSSKEVSVKIATNQSNFLTKEVFWEGFENFEYTKIFISLSKKVNSFYDIGANIGYFSILAGKANSNIEIHAFEPSKGPLYFLRKNCDLNNLNNVTISSLALSDRIGKITFYEIQNVKYTYLKHNLAGESNTGSKTSGRNYMPIEVDTIRLDDYYLNSGSKNKIDLIKIDTEGTEDVILENAHEILTNHRPIIICETLFGMIEDKLDALMTKYDYEFYNHTEKGLEKVSTIVRSKDNGVINCFFVHPSKAHLIEEYISKN
jgi:FkbM family methyltransferase